MKATVWGLFLFLFVVNACNSMNDNMLQDYGEIEVVLDASDGNTPVRSSSGSQTPQLDLSAFLVEIYNGNGVRIYSRPYSEAAGGKIRLNAGDYTLAATCGDSLATGFDAVYFAAFEDFTVRPQTSEQISAVCRQANVKVAVKYGPYILSEHPGIYSRVVRSDDSFLMFSESETRCGYIPAGMLTLEVYATIGGDLKMFRAEPVECFPNDFITFNVESTGTADAGITVGITVDGSLEDREYEQSIPFSMTPDAEPKATVTGFGDGNIIPVVEGIGAPGSMSIYAPAGISECLLKISSPSLELFGVPSVIDLTDPDPDAAAVLRKFGLFFSTNVAGQAFAYADFRDFSRMMPTTDRSGTTVFSLYVKDAKGRETETGSYGYDISPVGLGLGGIPEGNVWATVLRDVRVTSTHGHVRVTLQYSTDGVEWTDCAVSSAPQGTDYVFPLVGGLEPASEYMIRALYNGNEYTATQPVTVRTEEAAQPGNPGFEDFTVEQLQIKLWFGSATREIYYPYAGDDRWWAVNSRRTMPSSTTPSNIEYKCTPTVAPSLSPHSGGRAAQVATISVNDYNIASTSLGTPVAGELFIGSSDDSGWHSSEGHAFPSRPATMSFWYTFEPYGQESFYAYVCVKASDGRVIGEASVDNMSAAAKWTRHTCRIAYSDMTSKAAQVYVIFKSSSASSPGITIDKEIVRNGSTTRAHVGSVLTVDDIEFGYKFSE